MGKSIAKLRPVAINILRKQHPIKQVAVHSIAVSDIHFSDQSKTRFGFEQLWMQWMVVRLPFFYYLAKKGDENH